MTPDAWWSEVVKRAFLEGKPEALVAWKELTALQSKLAQYESKKGAPMKDFERQLRGLLNSYSQENTSNTPDFILVGYLLACLAAFNQAVQQRETWYGRDASPTSPEGTVVRDGAEGASRGE